MTRLIPLNGRHAQGAASHAIVDDDQYEELAQWRWKAKPNGSGSGIYAVRNTIDRDGVNRTIRMHRSVLGYEGPLDIDHINRNPLDNRRENLRIVTRSENGKNRRTFVLSGVCSDCGCAFESSNRSGVVPGRCSQCQDVHEDLAPRSFVSFLTCACGVQFVGRHANATHCSSRCRERDNQRAKRSRRKQASGFTLSAEQLQRNRERSRAWRAQQQAAGGCVQGTS